MKSRLPRKYKKKVKKQVSALIAVRAAKSAVISATSMAQMVSVLHTYGYTAFQKTVSAAEITANAAVSIGRIMSEKPNHWKDFIKS